jgi:hypothetical protein
MHWRGGAVTLWGEKAVSRSRMDVFWSGARTTAQSKRSFFAPTRARRALHAWPSGASSYYYICVLILLCVSAYYYICLRMLVYMRPDTPDTTPEGLKGS